MTQPRGESGPVAWPRGVGAECPGAQAGWPAGEVLWALGLRLGMASPWPVGPGAKPGNSGRGRAGGGSSSRTPEPAVGAQEDAEHFDLHDAEGDEGAGGGNCSGDEEAAEGMGHFMDME